MTAMDPAPADSVEQRRAEKSREEQSPWRDLYIFCYDACGIFSVYPINLISLLQYYCVHEVLYIWQRSYWSKRPTIYKLKYMEMIRGAQTVYATTTKGR